MDERGKILHAPHAGRTMDYTDVRYNNGTPTDIDGMMEFGDKVFIFFEYKYNDAKMPFGQRLALERVCDAIQSSGRQSMVITASYNNKTGDIDGANAIITEYRYIGRWITPKCRTTVKDGLDAFMEFCNYQQGNSKDKS